MRTYRHPEDYAAIGSLWESIARGIHLGRLDRADEIAEKPAHASDLLVLAEPGSQPVGGVMGGFDGRREVMHQSGVSKAARRKGIGRALLREIENRLWARGCLKCDPVLNTDNPDGIQY